MAEPAAEFRGIGKRFGPRTALRGLDLQLHPGEVLALVGSNGGGKTTTLRLLAGLVRPDFGDGRVVGCDLRGRLGPLRRQVGYVSQHFSLYRELTVTENLRFRAEVHGLDKPRQAVEAALDAFGLQPWARRPAGQLSGGWMSRLQFAASLIHRPALLLLDEPTAGLDVRLRAETWSRLFALAREGVAVAVSTHDLPEAQACSTVSVLADGALLASGPPGELIERFGQGHDDLAFDLHGADLPLARVTAHLLGRQDAAGGR